MPGNKPILIINGPNLNFLNYREAIYPNHLSYQDLCRQIKKYDSAVEFFQSNSEGEIIDQLQSLIRSDKYCGVIINPAGYSHTSVAILDTLLMIDDLIKVEVHLTDVFNREEFRRKLITAQGVDKLIYGGGLESYLAAIDYIRDNSNL